MAAFAFVLLMFGVWCLLGWPVVCFLLGGRHLLQNALLAPVAGAAVLMLAMFEGGRWGMAVETTGPVVTAVGVALALGTSWRRGYLPPWRRLASFGAIVLVGAFLVGYPLLRYGFDWLSFCNEDMANYTLAATAFLKRSYLTSYDPRLLFEWRDMTLAQWLPITLLGLRSGAELLLAWAMSLTGLTAHQIFMPAIVALHLVLITASGALVARGRAGREAARLVCLWMAVSALVAFGTVYQLIAQVFGMALLVGAAAVLMEPFGGAPRRAEGKRALLGAIFCAALGVAYPEIIPFLALAFFAAHGLALLRRREPLAPLARACAVASVATWLLWNTFAGCVPAFLRHQADSALKTTGATDVLFPYYLIPSGLPTYWGLLPVAGHLGRPWMDIAIAGGALLLAAAVAAVAWQAWQGQPAAWVGAIMLALAVRLAWLRADFGLYKLAMYSQPFLIVCLVLACVALGRRSRIARWAPVLLVAGLGLPSQIYYVHASAGSGGSGSGFVEIPRATPLRVSSLLRRLGRQPRRDLVVSDISNVVVAKMVASYFAPTRLEFPMQDVFGTTVPAPRDMPHCCAMLFHPGSSGRAWRTLTEWHDRLHNFDFDMHGGPPNSYTEIPVRRPGEQYTALLAGPQLSVLNRRRAARGDARALLSLVPSESLHDNLILINSRLGNTYYYRVKTRHQDRVALFQLEPDYFLPGETMSAVGRHLLFEVLRPSAGMRLQVDYTASLLADGENRIPPASAMGARRVPFQVVGRGSARLFSSPLEVQTIRGRHYVALDLGCEGRMFRSGKSGLMAWYGKAIPLDSRQITGFVRDISALGSAEYDALRAPSGVSAFPSGLTDKALEYSGIYEDGWVGEESELRLRQPAPAAVLSVRLTTPWAGRRLRVSLDGRTMVETALRPGENEIRTLAEGPAGRRRIGLSFDRAAPLPPPDGRPAAARLLAVGFSAGNRLDIGGGAVAIGAGWYEFETWRGESFRWMENGGGFIVTVPGRKTGELALDLAPGPGLGNRPAAIFLKLPDGSVRQLPALTGRQVVHVPLTLSGGARRFSLQVKGGGLVVGADPRKLNLRAFSIAWTPRS